MVWLLNVFRRPYPEHLVTERQKNPEEVTPGPVEVRVFVHTIEGDIGAPAPFSLPAFCFLATRR